MVADTLGNSERDGTFFVADTPFRKVFSWGGRILIGSSGMLWKAPKKYTIRFEAGSPKSCSFEYEFEKWISSFCLEHADSHATPSQIAEEILIKARKTFQCVETLAKESRWRDDNPGDPIVIYIVAGFSSDFGEFGIYETRVNFNAEGNGLEYVPVLCHSDKVVLTGQVEYIMRASSEEEPYVSLLRTFRASCAAQIEDAFPDVEPDIKEFVAYAVGAIRVQSKFARTVGSSVTIMVVEKSSGRAIEASL
jgi:hypothetical protein